ncbi:unnamed protein product [Aphis gossypii]|uniref:CCDC81 HU domain-containing protein n=1 Tax=Aphis gossypii TaxID=80765 RepID=A0A9P0IWJ2_APHGO|nr:unnamed protein product [Aphis gossypii]
MVRDNIGYANSNKDLQKVWECIAQSIENNMIKDKGTLLKGIGYFTVAKWMINENKVHPNTIRKPVFVIEEKLAKDFNLKRSRPYNSGIVNTRTLFKFFIDCP